MSREHKDFIHNSKFRPQIKICGLTRVDEAMRCAELGADAVGCVFYPKSPRNVTENRAREISQALPRNVKTVGVFVNESYDDILRKVKDSLLDAVQLHGQEPPGLVARLKKETITVIKALFVDGRPSMEQAAEYTASGVSGGMRPGGASGRKRAGLELGKGLRIFHKNIP